MRELDRTYPPGVVAWAAGIVAINALTSKVATAMAALMTRGVRCRLVDDVRYMSSSLRSWSGATLVRKGNLVTKGPLVGHALCALRPA